MTVPLTDVSTAIIARVSTLFSVPIDPASVDPDLPFLAEHGFMIGDQMFDSINLVEMLVTLEDEFGVQLLNSPRALKFDTVTKLSEYIIQNTSSSKIADFCRSVK